MSSVYSIKDGLAKISMWDKINVPRNKQINEALADIDFFNKRVNFLLKQLNLLKNNKEFTEGEMSRLMSGRFKSVFCEKLTNCKRGRCDFAHRYDLWFALKIFLNKRFFSGDIQISSETIDSVTLSLKRRTNDDSKEMVHTRGSNRYSRVRRGCRSTTSVPARQDSRSPDSTTDEPVSSGTSSVSSSIESLPSYEELDPDSNMERVAKSVAAFVLDETPEPTEPTLGIHDETPEPTEPTLGIHDETPEPTEPTLGIHDETPEPTEPTLGIHDESTLRILGIQ